MNKILIFIPMYNCNPQIERVLTRIVKLKDSSCFNEVIIIDNNSRDSSIECAKKVIKGSKIKMKIFLNDDNYNLGGSHKVAFNYAIENEFSHILVLHGDDQGDINDVIPFILNGECLKFDSFLGSRFNKESKLINYSKFRIFGNHVFNRILSLLVRDKVEDLGSGLNLYKVDYLKSKFYLNFPDTLTFNVYMLLYGIYVKSNFDYFPLTWREEDQVSNAKFYKQSKEIASLAFQYIANSEKLFKTNKSNKDMNYTYTEISSSCLEENLK